MAIGVAMACIVAFALADMRRDAVGRANDSAGNIALILQRDIENNLDVYGLSLQAVIDHVRDPVILRQAPRIRHLVLFDTSVYAQDMGSVLVTNPAGKVVFDSLSVVPRKLDLSGRDYFKYHRDALTDGLYISAPFTPMTMDDGQTIGISRRLDGDPSRFPGIAVETIRLSYFQRLFQGIELGEHGTLTLVRNDGMVLMRRPYRREVIGHFISGDDGSGYSLPGGKQGTFIKTGLLDHLQRLYSYRQMEKYPLTIIVGQALDEVYREWRRRAWVIGGVTAGFELVLFVLLLLFAQEMRRRQAMQQRVQAMADTDSLTGVGSRRALDGVLKAEWAQARRAGRSCAILMADIDHFKDFNDLHGHAVGDLVLASVGRCIADVARHPGGFVGRYGGEEFCVVLPGHELAEAVAVAECIRDAVQKIELPPGMGSRLSQGMSVSIGVAASGRGAGTAGAVELLLQQADRQLYEAKNAGRNVVMPGEVRPSATHPSSPSLPTRQAG